MESFSKKAKDELSSLPLESCKSVYYELFGALILGAEKQSKDTFYIQRQNNFLTKRILILCNFILGNINQSKKYKLNIKINTNEKHKVIDNNNTISLDVPLKIEPDNLSNIEPGNLPAFLRGAFLACASIANPQVEYHMEFCIPSKELCDSLLKIINSIKTVSLNPKVTKRRNSYIIYFKDSEKITDFLVFIGAQNCAMSFIQEKMIKEVRNNINRTTNFETANMSKTASSSAEQIDAIKTIKKLKGLDFLPDSLRETAILRLNNPYLSLNELVKISNFKITRSGLNHRLSKLMEISKKMT